LEAVPASRDDDLPAGPPNEPQAAQEPVQLVKRCDLVLAVRLAEQLGVPRKRFQAAGSSASQACSSWSVSGERHTSA
jgi:hypothetical protein